MSTRRAALVAIGAAACLPALARADTLTVTVPSQGASLPMLDFGRRPVVEVTINGKGPFRLILDTGADITVLDTSLAAEIGLTGTDAQLDEVRIGPITLSHVDAFISPISRIMRGDEIPRGVLSAAVFPGSLLTFDYPGKRLLVTPGALPQADGRTVFSYAGADLPSIPVKVAGHEITVHLDTGAPYAVALPTRYMKGLPLVGEPKQVGTARSSSGAHPVFTAMVDAEVAIGDFALATRELRFTDVVPEPNAVPKGQVGGDALRDYRLTLDSLNRRLRLSR